MSTQTEVRQQDQSDQFLAAMDRQIDPVKTPLRYKLALLLAALFMVLLPLVYLAIACGFAYVVYYHAIHSVSIFEHVRGRGVLIAFVIYVGPLVAGVTAVLFMFKPLFSRTIKQSDPHSLTRADEPMLFEFVDKLCDTVHAPRPRRIDVDCQVNASASFRRGALSLLLSNDLVLTIGLPLVAGMSLREFGGILAHEFGHFSQGGGMRLSYVVRSVSHWFTRVVYERDTWDAFLESWSREVDIRIGAIFYLARGCVWLTRKILWGLMMAGHGVSGILLRQMEFDADRHEVRFSGSDVIASTTRRLHELTVAHEMALSDLELAFQEGRLADDVVRLVSMNVEELPAAAETFIDQQITDGKTGWLDTHPCDRERIASGQKENAPGVFRLEVPAEQLFVDFPGVCQRATVSFYQAILGDAFRSEQLHLADDVVAARKEHNKAIEAFNAYFQNGWQPLRSFSVPFKVLPTHTISAATDATNFTRHRQQMLELAKDQKAANQKIAAADAELTECSQASLLLDAEFQVRSDMFSHNLSSKRLLSDASKSVNAKWTAAESSYAAFQTVVETRLWRAISLLVAASVQAGIPDANAWVVECNERLLPALHAMMGAFRNVMNLRSEFDRFMICIQLLQNGHESDGLVREIRACMSDLKTQLAAIRGKVDQVGYPFSHLEQDMTLKLFLCKTLPSDESIEGHFEATSGLLENYMQTYQRLLARCCEMAQAVELFYGLEPLPIPDPEPVPDPAQSPT